jgi:hypothetical protein
MMLGTALSLATVALAGATNPAGILGPLLGIVFMSLIIYAARAWRRRIPKD